MRLIRFLLIFLGVAILVVGSIFWINRDTFISVFQNRAAILEGSEWVEKTYSLGGLIEFMAEQPHHAALVSMPVATGNTTAHAENPEGAVKIRHGSDRILPGGTLNNLLLLLSYAEQKHSGSIDPDAPVDTYQLQTLYIPGIDNRYRRDFNRWLSERESTPTIQQLSGYLVDTNDPAAADYLFFRLGEDNIFHLTSKYGGNEIEPPVPQFGLRMLALEHPETKSLSGHLAHLDEKDRNDLLNEAVAIARKQWNHPGQIEEKSINSFQDQRALNGLYPHLEPDQFAVLLSDLWTGSLICEDVSRIVRKMLLRPVEDRLMEPDVSEYASQFDERMGYLSGWTIAIEEAEDEKWLRVQVIMITDIPAGLWFHMNSNFMIRDFHNRMLYDRNIRNRSFRLLVNNG